MQSSIPPERYLFVRFNLRGPVAGYQIRTDEGALGLRKLEPWEAKRKEFVQLRASYLTTNELDDEFKDLSDAFETQLHCMRLEFEDPELNRTTPAFAEAHGAYCLNGCSECLPGLPLGAQAWLVQ